MRGKKRRDRDGRDPSDGQDPPSTFTSHVKILYNEDRVKSRVKNMNQTPSPEKKYEMLKWLNRHRQNLLDSYKNQYIAYNSKGLIAHSENLQEVLDFAKASGEVFVIYLVPLSTTSVQILPIRFRTV